ncbi:MAG: U32 family peptidase [Clostridia bacterium]|nr:U32 family peptidase [Clostridia bacterium]
MKKPELLCPVGGEETLSAALFGGADAVYLGTREFNARMNAKNFDRNSLPSVVRRCHERGVRVYVTLNTLLTDRQIPEALSLAAALYREGVDALIVADLGLARLLHLNFPRMELHASTQMSAHNTEAVRYLASEGFFRAVCARELDRENLAELCGNSPLEIEAFVHGAVCASHSGQCLMSSMIGDRSGNRGECAQPCRLPYRGGYLLSFKDLTLARHVTELIPMGIRSLKIEGRMKSPAYVYSVTRLWRTLLDENRNATPKEIEKTAAVFSRSGFTDGYFTKRIGEEMLGIRTEGDKSKSEGVRVSFRDGGPRGKRIETEKREVLSPHSELPPKEKSPFCRTARFLSPDQIPEGDFFREKYLPLASFEGGAANGVVLPPVVFDSEWGKVREDLEKAVAKGAKHVLVGNLGHFSLAEDLPVTLHGDFRLNLTNSFSLNAFPFLADAIVSPELNLAQLRDLRGKKRVIVYGRIPLMLLEKKPSGGALRDRRGVLFPVIEEGGRSIVLNSVPLYMADKQKELKEKGLTDQHFIFTVETPEQVKRILSAWQNKKEPTESVRRIR